MPTLKDILDDRKTFSDDMEFTTKDGQKIPLGDLRKLSDARQQDISDKLAAADKRLTEVGELATAAAALKEKYEQQIAEAEKGKGNRGTPTEDEFESDPFWAPVRKRYSAADETLKKLNDTVTNLAKASEKMATIWAQDRWKGQFDRLAPRLAKSSKHKDMTFDKVREYAAANRLVDEFGFPSVEKAILELTREEDFEARLAEARKQGVEEGVLKGRMAASGRPTSATGPKKPEKSVVGEKGLEGLGDDVAADPELTKMLADLGAADPADFGGSPV